MKTASLSAKTIKHWLSVGAQATDRVQRLLAQAGLVRPSLPRSDQQDKPKAKALERIQEKEEAKLPQKPLLKLLLPLPKKHRPKKLHLLKKLHRLRRPAEEAALKLWLLLKKPLLKKQPTTVSRPGFRWRSSSMTLRPKRRTS